MFGSMASVGPGWLLAIRSAISSAGLSRKSSMSGLNARPKQAMVTSFAVLLGFACKNSATETLTLSSTHCGLLSFTSRAVRISLACSGVLLTINQGSTAMQWPPTPGPGCKILTRGWRLARRIRSQTLIFSLSQIIESSLAKAIFTSRKLFSVSLHISAVRASVTMHSP
ncbi:hypothetical protein D3C76_1270940 [compost metagenome]